MPPILHYGFRPFFFLASLHAGLAIPAWLGAYLGGFDIGGPFGGMHWHAHEMLFGYTTAALTGFLLTTIPNWTGRLPVYMIFLDQFYYETNHSRFWMDLLEDPLRHRLSKRRRLFPAADRRPPVLRGLSRVGPGPEL